MTTPKHYEVATANDLANVILGENLHQTVYPTIATVPSDRVHFRLGLDDISDHQAMEDTRNALRLIRATISAHPELDRSW